jgi:hypothetical protein
MKDERFYKLAFKTFGLIWNFVKIISNNALIGMFINIYVYRAVLIYTISAVLM